MHHKYTWPTNLLKGQLGNLLNNLHAHSDYQIADWTSWTTQIPDWTTMDLTFASAPRQQEGDGINCAIIVILMMELRLVYEEVPIDKFPISKTELFLLRKRLCYNLNRSNTARILFHINNNFK